MSNRLWEKLFEYNGKNIYIDGPKNGDNPNKLKKMILQEFPEGVTIEDGLVTVEPSLLKELQIQIEQPIKDEAPQPKNRPSLYYGGGLHYNDVIKRHPSEVSPLTSEEVISSQEPSVNKRRLRGTKNLT